MKYLEYYKNLYYNEREKISDDDLWLILLTCDSFEELYEISDQIMNKKERDKFLRGVKNMSANDFIIEQDELDKMNKIMELSKEERLIEEATENGLKQGIEQNKLDIVKKLLEKNYDIKEIADITNLSEEKMLKIKDQKNT